MGRPPQSIASPPKPWRARSATQDRHTGRGSRQRGGRGGGAAGTGPCWWGWRQRQRQRRRLGAHRGERQGRCAVRVALCLSLVVGCHRQKLAAPLLQSRPPSRRQASHIRAVTLGDGLTRTHKTPAGPAPHLSACLVVCAAGGQGERAGSTDRPPPSRSRRTTIPSPRGSCATRRHCTHTRTCMRGQQQEPSSVRGTAADVGSARPYHAPLLHRMRPSRSKWPVAVAGVTLRPHHCSQPAVAGGGRGAAARVARQHGRLCVRGSPLLATQKPPGVSCPARSWPIMPKRPVRRRQQARGPLWRWRVWCAEACVARAYAGNASS